MSPAASVEVWPNPRREQPGERRTRKKGQPRRWQRGRTEAYALTSIIPLPNIGIPRTSLSSREPPLSARRTHLGHALHLRKITVLVAASISLEDRKSVV